MIIKSRKENGIGFEFKDFRHGLNSGFCAFQLALLLGYKEIYLLGIDLNIQGKTHYHGGYNESEYTFAPKLNRYFELFKEAILEVHSKTNEIKIYNCSEDGRLNSILPYRSLEEL